jgi:hypothetical protein
MPRYFFDLRDDETFAPDDDGVELPDMQAAQVEAARTLLDTARLLSRRPAQSLHGHLISIEVRDDRGSVLRATLAFDGERSLN